MSMRLVRLVRLLVSRYLRLLDLLQEQLVRAVSTRRTRLRDTGQATAEYALVMLGAAVVALLVVSWATAGGGAGKVGRLFDRVLDAVIDRV